MTVETLTTWMYVLRHTVYKALAQHRPVEAAD
jgi:hypothetical protein